MAGAIRVLAVEDDPSARALLSAVLSGMEGVKLCGVAADGLEGLEMVEKLRPDAVLLDLIMPGMDGLGFLRAMGGQKNRPVVVVTSQAGDPALIHHALSLGAGYYLVKPLNFRALPDLLEGLCLQPLVQRGVKLLEEMGAKGRGVTAAARAAAVLARDDEALLKQAYAPTIAADGTNYAGVEKNIRAMVDKLHRAASPGYLALLRGLPAARPSNLVFLKALARALSESK